MLEICYSWFISLIMDIWVLSVFTCNTFVQLILWTYTPNPLNSYFGLKLLDHKYIYVTLLDAIKDFPRVAVPLCTPSRKMLSIANAQHLHQLLYCQPL